MSFHDVRFPEGLSFGAMGGPLRQVDIVQLANGREIRSTPWRQNRRRYLVGTGIKSKEELYLIISFFEARRGQLHSFRYKDWTDFRSCGPDAEVNFQDQVIARADGVKTDFQLIKNYRSGDVVATRTITKPLAQSVKVGIDDLQCEEGSDYEVDTNQGIIKFARPPETGAPIYAGYEFDVPVRFDTSELMISLSQFEAGEIADIPLIEVLE